MNDEARIELAGEYGRDDLVERQGRCLDLRCEQFQGEIGGGHGSGDGDADALDLIKREGLLRDDHRAVVFTDRAPAGHQGVVVLDVRIGVKADSRDVVGLLIACLAVECLDIGQGVGKAIARNAHFICGESVEHKGVVGVGAMGDADFTSLWRCFDHEGFQSMCNAGRSFQRCAVRFRAW